VPISGGWQPKLRQTCSILQRRCGFAGQSVQGVMKELCISLLVYNLMRIQMLRWALAAGIDVRRVSFIDACRWLASRALRLAGVDGLIVNPPRPGRTEPRVVRRRPRKYTLLTTPRSKWKCPENKAETA
jgi:hypothetical protein